MSLISVFLDKASRLTSNPDLCHLPERLCQRSLQLLHYLGIYRIPELPVLRRFDGRFCIHMLPGEGEEITKNLIFCGYWEYNQEYFVRSFLRRGMIVIDGGANVGHIALICANRVQPTGQVHAFEPLSRTFEILRVNVKANGVDGAVRLNKCALTDISGGRVFLDRSAGRSHLTRLTRGRRESGDEDWSIGEEGVPAVALDDYVNANALARVDLLKLDVEGAEVLAIKGAEKLLGRYQPTITCEFNNPTLNRLGSSAEELWRSLSKHDYKFCLYNHRQRVLKVMRTCPEGDDVVNVVCSTDLERLAEHVRARIV